MLKNILLALASLVFCLLITEALLSVLDYPRLAFVEEKAFIHTKKGLGSCYSSNPQKSFPVDLTRPADYQGLEQIFLFDDANRGLTAVRETTPYCVVYDEDRRKRGYFPERKTTAAILGDSFAFGEGVPEEATLAFLLSGKFAQVNFQTAAWSGADIRHAFEQAQSISEREPRPALVIYFQNINDILLSEELARRQRALIDLENLRWSVERGAEDPKLQWAISHMHLANLIWRVLRTEQQTVSTIDTYNAAHSFEQNRTQLERSLNYVAQTKSLLEARKIKFVVVLYPLLHKDPLGKYPFVQAHETLRTWYAEHQIAFLDGLPAFETDYAMKRYIVHPVDFHPNAEANEKMAVRVADYLKSNEEFRAVLGD